MKPAFLKRGTRPNPAYQPVVTDKAREHITAAQSMIKGDDVIAEWLTRLCDTMVSTVGLFEFCLRYAKASAFEGVK